MFKLNQVIAILSGCKTKTMEEITQIYHQLQKPELLNGMSRSYKPQDELGTQLPPESKLVQLRVPVMTADIVDKLTQLFDLVATQDYANCLAKADIKVGDTVLAAGVPVTYLLFLEKQLLNIKALVAKTPVLSPEERWTFDATQDCYVSESYQSTKTQKTYKNHVKAEATKEHPAQVETYTEDVIIGTYTAVKYSGAIPLKQRNEMLARVQQVMDAVKIAREIANGMEVEKKQVGDALLGFIFTGP